MNNATGSMVDHFRPDVLTYSDFLDEFELDPEHPERRVVLAQAKFWRELVDYLILDPDDGDIPQIVMMVGLPSSGKTSWIERQLMGLERFFKGQYNDRPYIGATELVIDHRYLTAEIRRPIVNLFVGAGYEVKAVYVDTPLSSCMSRSWRRMNDNNDPFDLTPQDVAGMYAIMEPPRAIEGFSHVQTIRPQRPQ